MAPLALGTVVSFCTTGWSCFCLVLVQPAKCFLLSWVRGLGGPAHATDEQKCSQRARIYPRLPSSGELLGVNFGPQSLLKKRSNST